jgi:phage-related protein
MADWGMPHVRSLRAGLREVRSGLPNGIARVLLVLNDREIVLRHGFITKTQKTPPEALALADKRRRDCEQSEED